jgi:hypothetical protein
MAERCELYQAITIKQGITFMTKRIFFLLGILAGFLLAEVLRRKQLERLQTFEADKAEQHARYMERTNRCYAF